MKKNPCNTHVICTFSQDACPTYNTLFEYECERVCVCVPEQTLKAQNDRISRIHSLITQIFCLPLFVQFIHCEEFFFSCPQSFSSDCLTYKLVVFAWTGRPAGRHGLLHPPIRMRNLRETGGVFLCCWNFLVQWSNDYLHAHIHARTYTQTQHTDGLLNLYIGKHEQHSKVIKP